MGIENMLHADDEDQTVLLLRLLRLLHLLLPRRVVVALERACEIRVLVEVKPRHCHSIYPSKGTRCTCMEMLGP